VSALSGRFGIIVHGGAVVSKSLGDGILSSRREHMIKAVEEGMGILRRRGNGALDAAESAVTLMESSGAFNAGKGSCLTITKETEMDAGIMDGSNLQCGAVGAIRDVINPIQVARKVLELTPHALLAGGPAASFADSNGIPLEKIGVTKIKFKMFDELTKSKSHLRYQEFGTVGAVVIDKDGNLASAVSTGGTWLKMEGRIGDSAIVGAGFYADNRAGASVATGNGEAIMKLCLSKYVCDLMPNGMNAKVACNEAVRKLTNVSQGWGGVIAIDPQGQVGIANNTEGMPRAYLFNDMDSPQVAIFEKENQG